MNITLPYGKSTFSVQLSKDQILEVIAAKTIPASQPPIDLINHALTHPLGASPVQKLVSANHTVAIVVDDYTRPSPTKQLLPPLLSELHEAHIPDEHITIIIATGTHTPPTSEQIENLVGPDIAYRYRIISNDNDNSTYVSVGTSKYGHDIQILKEYVDADCKILVGDIEYHYFAGFGGTRKSILPGISSRETIQQNHAMMFHHASTTGSLKENPINIEMTEALDLVGCDFALYCVLNEHHEIVGVWAGDAHQVMNEGVDLVNQMYQQRIPRKPDIILISADGHPHDINLYQAMKAMYTAAQVIAEHGIIILVAACPEGMGNERYIRWMEQYCTANEIQQGLESCFEIGAHKAYYHRQIAEEATVYLVSSMDPNYVKELGFHPFSTPQDALDHAFAHEGKDKKVLVVPNGTTSHLVLNK